jgi:uncharacterized membrane protein YfcA
MKMSEGYTPIEQDQEDNAANGKPHSTDASTAPGVQASWRRVATWIVSLQIIAAVISTLAGTYVPRVLEPILVRVIELTRLLGAPYQSRVPVELAVVLISLVMGNVLYAFRYRWPRVYGTLEIVVALASALAVAHQLYYPNEPLSPYFAPTLIELAALYIFVRGMDNIYRSFTPKSRRQQAWEKLYFGKVVTS